MDWLKTITENPDAVLLLLAALYALHKRWVVMGWVFEDEREEKDDLKRQLIEANTATAATNKVNADLAALVPGLMADLRQAQRDSTADGSS